MIYIIEPLVLINNISVEKKKCLLVIQKIKIIFNLYASKYTSIDNRNIFSVHKIKDVIYHLNLNFGF